MKNKSEQDVSPKAADATESKAAGKTKTKDKKIGKGKAKRAEKKKQESADARLLRLQADFENFRKRVLRERNELYQRANEDIMEELLPVLDHMDLALEAVAAHQEEDAFVEGVRLVFEQLNSALQKFGLKPIEAKGQPFDPNLHEAVSHLPSEQAEENTVMEQVRRGYTLGGRVLRAPQVVVSKGAAEPEGSAES